VKVKHLGKRNKQFLKPHFSILDSIKRNNAVKSIHGIDIWNAYEFYYLDDDFKPVHFPLELKFPSHSKYTVESKSLKLYLNSFYKYKAKSNLEISKKIQTDIFKVCKIKIKISELRHIFLTQKNIKLKRYKEQSNSNDYFFFDGFRSVCPVTNQPDFGKIYFKTSNKKIPSEEIFNYLLSFQEHNAFHETCIEEIYHQFESYFMLKNLIVIGKFMRRGGISINPIRSYKPILKNMIFHEQYQ